MRQQTALFRNESFGRNHQEHPARVGHRRDEDFTVEIEIRDPSGRPVGEGDGVDLPTLEHAFTHLRATYVPVALEVRAPEPGSSGASPKAAWIEADRPTHLALPVAPRRVMASFMQDERAGARTRTRLDGGG